MTQEQREKLTERNRLIVELSKQPDMPTRRIADKFKLTKVRVNQIVRSAALSGVG